MTRRGRTAVAISVRIEEAVADSARAAVAALRDTDNAIDGGMSGLVEQALEREVKRLERQHNNGEAFPDAGPLKPGPAV